MPAEAMGDNGRMDGSDIWLAGVDGCRAGWVVAFVRPSGDEAHIRVVRAILPIFWARRNSHP